MNEWTNEMGRGHTDRAQRAELPIRHPPGGDVGRSSGPLPGLLGRLGSSRRCRARRGSRRAEGTREELEMGWNGMERREPGGEGDGGLEWNWNWILSRARLFRWPFAIPAFFYRSLG